MQNIIYYKNKSGRIPVKEYLDELAAKKDKDSRIKLNKIADYIEALANYGTMLGMPYLRHLEDELWELRPGNNRVFFVAWHNNSFVLLHCYIKKTQKTPKVQINRAREELKDIKERGIDNGE